MRPGLLVARSAALAVLLAACGGGSLPGGDAGDGKLSGPPVLAPLATGARWTYRVTDPAKGVFDKHVEVLGGGMVPDSGEAAVVVRDVEPTNEETAWLEVTDGFLVRKREEDRKAGQLVRATTWSPPAPKWLAATAPAGFTVRVTVAEREAHADGSVGVKDPIYAFTVVATGVAVTVPAGTFTCVQVERQRIDKVDPKHTYWLAPNVGKVREESDRIEELVSYQPGT